MEGLFARLSGNTCRSAETFDPQDGTARICEHDPAMTLGTSHAPVHKKTLQLTAAGGQLNSIAGTPAADSQWQLEPIRIQRDIRLRFATAPPAHLQVTTIQPGWPRPTFEIRDVEVRARLRDLQTPDPQNIEFSFEPDIAGDVQYAATTGAADKLKRRPGSGLSRDTPKAAHQVPQQPATYPRMISQHHGSGKLDPVMALRQNRLSRKALQHPFPTVFVARCLPGKAYEG